MAITTGNEDLPIDELTAIYQNYSVKDVAESLLISSLWLPNIATPVRHLVASSILVTMNPQDFAHDDKIKSYLDFKKFLEQVFAIMPSFPQIEDYIPELDWGEVSFHYNNHNYRIMYGSEIEHPYDFLEFFRMFYGSIRQDILSAVHRDLLEDLKNILQLQEDIILGLRSQPSVEEVKKRIDLGYFEVPSEQFWKASRDFIRNYQINERLSNDFLEHFCIELGSLNKETLNSQYHDLIWSGKLLNSLFLKIEDAYIPILPRRCNAILLDRWSEKIDENYDDIISKLKNYTEKLGCTLNNFFESRIDVTKSSFFQFVSAVNKDETPDKTLFISAFVSRNRLILLYLAKPQNAVTGLKEELMEIRDDLKTAKDLISSAPVTFGCHSKGEKIVFETRDDGLNIKPLIVVLVPFLSLQMSMLSLSSPYPGRIIFLDQFIGIIDEVNDVDEFALFFDYLDEYRPNILPMADMLDIFVSFKVSKGVLIRGATRPTIISLETHMGSNERFESLSKFWKKFPNTFLLGHPRAWRVEQKTDDTIALYARNSWSAIISPLIGRTRFFITSPFEKQNQEQLKTSTFLTECLQDTLSTRKSLFATHAFFSKFSELFIILFPYSLIEKQNYFAYLKHLNPSKNKWVSDYGLNQGIPTIRVVYNEEAVFEAFRQTTDSSEEVNLLLEILSSINKLVTDKNFVEIEKAIINTKTLMPRFKMFWMNRAVSFPEFVHSNEPTETHYKLAKKRVSEIAKDANLAPGYYEVKEAKRKIDELRKGVVNEVNSVVGKYDLEKTIPFLLTQLEALTHKYETARSLITMSLEHQVDYSRQEELANEQTKYLRLHRNNRYLIEKFVQISPKSKEILEVEGYLFLVALIDLLHGLYQASDSLHYGLSPLGVNITDEYLFEVIYKENYSEQQDLFFKEMAELQLGMRGNSGDRIESPYPIEEFLSKIDMAFKQDLNFGFKDMINVLQVLSLWADFTQATLNTCYSAKINQIAQVCSRNIIGFDQNSLENILDFLTLKQNDVIRVIGHEKPCSDLPVWEINKRFSRYTIRPLIKINDQHYWGPYSAMKTGLLWTTRLSEGGLPFDIQGETIKKAIQDERSCLDKELENKTYEIVKRFTKCVERNVELFKRDRRGKHSRELGDFDVLSYLPEKNVILNIECKHLPGEFCLKDLQRLQRTVFNNYLVKFNRRREYLTKNYYRVMQVLGWAQSKGNKPKIISVFLIDKSFLWTRYPPKGLNISFVQIEFLSEFITNLQ